MPLIPFTQFVGADYVSRSVNVAVSELVNFYIEMTQSPSDQSPFPTRLQPTPGLAIFAQGMQGPIRAVLGQDGRCFVVGGSKVYELQGDGRWAVVGTVAVDDQPATLTSNGHGGHQLLITSAGLGYIYDLASGQFQQITSAGFPSNVVMGDYIDGYSLVLQASTSKFFLSASADGLTWNAKDYGLVSSSSDDLLAFRVQARNIWNFGSMRTEIWTNQPGSGTAFPLAPIQPLIECGIAAPWAIGECFGTLCFIVKTKLGDAAVMRTNGYGVDPISTPSENRILSDLPDLANVRAYSYQEDNHIFYVICPNTGPALVYDLVTNLWHRRGRWDAGQATYQPLRQWCHSYAFGKHLVGDRESGTIYEQALDLGTDAGERIRRVRTCPHLNQDQQYLFGGQVTIGVESGLDAGLVTPEGVFVPADVLLSFSKDGGHTFSEPRSGSLGRQGHYGHLLSWHQTPGRFHDLVLRAETTATTPVRINSCQLRIEAGRGQR